MTISFILNRKPVHCDVSPRKRLLDLLREDFDLIGTKEACGRGECGSCTVLMDGERVNSCLIPAFQAIGHRIVTIEGVREWPIFERVSRAYVEHGAVQCGLCIPGFVMSTVTVLAEQSRNPNAEPLEIALAGNLCRCTGYEKIIDAVRDLSQDESIRNEITQLVSGEYAGA